MRRFVRALGWIAAIVVAAAGLVAAASLYDPELTPEARAAFRGPGEPVLGNGFALLYGFDAPLSSDARATGERRIRQLREVSSRDASFRERPGRPSLTVAEELLCFPAEADCVALAASRNPVFFEDLATANAELLERYAQLQKADDFRDGGALFPDAPMAPYQLVVQVQSAYLSLAASRAARGDLDAAVSMLEADAAFTRRWLGQSQLLVSKMVAQRAVLRDLLVAGHVARASTTLSAAQFESLARIARPLEPAELSLGAVFRIEASSLPAHVERIRHSQPLNTASMASAARRAPGFELDDVGLFPYLPRFLVAPNATLNLMAPVVQSWHAFDTTSTAGLQSAAVRVRAANDELLEPGIKWLYNPMGRVLASWLTSFDATEYVLRLRDLDALARAVCVQVRAKARGVDAASMASFVAQAGDDCRDPYTERPFQWDAERKQIWFEPRGERQRSNSIGGIKGRIGITTG